MNIQRFLAPTSREALAKARSVFGEGTLILSNRPTAQGVEVMATAEDSLQRLDSGHKTSPSLQAAIQAREAEETRPLRAAPQQPHPPKAARPMVAPSPAPGLRMEPALQASPRQSVQQDTEQLAMSTLSFQDYVRERMLRRRSEGVQDEIPEEQLPTFARKARAVESASNTGGGAMPAPVRQNPLRPMGAELPVGSAKAVASVPVASTGMMGELQSVKA